MHSLVMQGAAARASVIALSPREWRVSDPAQDEADGRALVGFVERVADRFEVTALQRPHLRVCFPTFEDAVGSLLG